MYAWQQRKRNKQQIVVDLSVSREPKPRLKKGVIPTQFSWMQKKRESAKQRNEHMMKRAVGKDSSNLSSISSSNPIPTEPCNEVEIVNTNGDRRP
ncbi:unnamed protein product [Diabrotica balteata]|uniref:Uncharacterized protein n=1 Tax=Diabrotica balteata TaxID=107213 RepID=A0A9N9SQV1_DIABA|nr:unnamed protein product [Diabrotica balteata]